MARANWKSASELQSQIPHTYAAFQNLIMAMADAYNDHGKSTWFGKDKGLKSYLKFELKLKEALIAMTMDGLVNRFDSSEKFLDTLVLFLSIWFEIFPGWPDAGQFAKEKFVINPSEARLLIASLIGLPK
jgi:hypothetical protein